ncbi:hypothetical protein [Auraticoccus monumenti]|uniref:Uncharacterized protein n=1 Tax=Auraticoccus monumenti TaxID=675864 RepID=A0A1G6SLS4_9ACTN|nr:hypothetical protein [Auraticoccus monumenti]SDD17743.1 hypothetical protein SAMN04489747_0363 [Auraticoccus monumenti]
MSATPGPHAQGDPARPGADPSGQGAPGQYPWNQAAPGPSPSGPAAPGPYPPGQPGPTGTRPARPATVRFAVLLMWVGAALSVVSLLTALAVMGQMRDMVADQLARQGVEATPEMVQASVTIGLVVAALSGLVGTALWILNAVFCGRGAGWSRILATVLAGIFLLNALYSLSQPSPVLSKVVLVLTMAVALGAVVLLWLKPSSDWFRAVRGPAAAPVGYGPPPGRA